MKRDKLYHILAGLLIAAVVGVPCYVNTHDLFAGLWGAMMGGIVAGAVKEYTDNAHAGCWDWKDLAFTCIGVAIAVLFILGLHFGKG